MPNYRTVGAVPHKRHVRVDDGRGTALHEEMIGAAGFSGESSLLYHRYSPSAIVDAAPVDDATPTMQRDPRLLPLHLRTDKVDAGGDFVSGRRELLVNDDVVISFATADRSSELYRNARGDELVYIQSGDAVLESVFGRLDVRPGDYVVIPTSTTHRWLVAAPVSALAIEAHGHVNPPARYLSARGQFLEHAPYCERDLRAPEDPLTVEETQVEVLVRHHDGRTRYRYEHHPFDVVGWAGCLYPYAFSIHDFEPIVGRIHQPPPVHQTFEGPGFVVCSFVPRPFDFHPDAIKVPYHHSNIDSDEVLFYSSGEFMSRGGSGVGVGSVTFHPRGFVHGPQPGSFERVADQDRTEEFAVMIDTFRPLAVTQAAMDASDPEYPWSWAAK
jgi:homogentisate 1,2-dioxygenase